MTTVKVTADNYQETIANNTTVIFDFWAPWCGPCRNFAPIFEEASDQYTDVVFGKINTDEEQKLAIDNTIVSIPTLVAFKNGKQVLNQAGSLPADKLADLVEKLKSLD